MAITIPIQKKTAVNVPLPQVATQKIIQPILKQDIIFQQPNSVPQVPLSNENELFSLTLPSPEDVWESPQGVENLTLFLYGGDGIGKSSFSAMFPDSFHLFYEPSGKDLGGKDLAGFRREPKNWEEFVKYVNLLEDAKKNNKLTFKYVVIDVVDICFYHCQADYLQKHNLKEMPNDYGKSWQAVESIFRENIYRLARCCGVIFISHVTEKKIEHLNGLTYDTLVPTIANKGNNVLKKFCDVKALYKMNGFGERTLVIQANTECEAKNRLDSKFRYINGDRINEIPMGNSKEESWENFSLALANKLPLPNNNNKSGVSITPRKVV